MSDLYNLEVEKHFIACILQYPDSLAEVSIINGRDFSPINGAIFKIIGNEINKGSKISTILIADKIKGYNIQLEGVDAYDYLEALKLLPINEKEIESLAKQLKKLSVLREYEEIGKNIVKKARSSQSEEFVDIVNGMDKMFNEKVNQFGSGTEEPQDLFSGIEEMVELAGENPRDPGIICPSFAKYHLFYNGFEPGNLVTVVSRAKGGKSTLLLNFALDAINNKDNGDVKVLLLDTEITLPEAQIRLLSSITNVNGWFLRSGYWRRNPDMVKKVREGLVLVKNLFNRIDHIYIGGKPFSEVKNLIRRWHHRKVERFSKSKALIIYDYIKLGAEMGQNNKEYIIVGQKVNDLKDLAVELCCPIITAAQANRSGEGREDSSKIVDDGSVVGLSDMINTLSSTVLLWRKPAIDEKIKYGEDFTHMLKPLYTRSLGRDTSGGDLVKYLDDKGKIMYTPNFIRYKVDNFKVEEMGDLKDWAAANGRLVAKEHQIQQEKKEGLF